MKKRLVGASGLIPLPKDCLERPYYSNGELARVYLLIEGIGSAGSNGGRPHPNKVLVSPGVRSGELLGLKAT